MGESAYKPTIGGTASTPTSSNQTYPTLIRATRQAVFLLLSVAVFWLAPHQNKVPFAAELAAAELTDETIDGLSIRLPKNRWSLDRTGSDWVNFGDSDYRSNFTVWSAEPNGLYDLSGFMKSSINRRLEGWSEDYGYDVVSEKEGVTKIGSGQEARYLMFTLDINSNSRDVAFLYFAEKNTGGQEIRWYRVFVRGDGDSYDAGLETVKKIASGLFLTGR